MKKILFVFALLFATVAANAQFERGKWLVNTSVTGLDLSFASSSNNDQGTKNHFGFLGEGGYFIMDNLAIIGTLGGDWASKNDLYTIGGKARYYFDKVGFYAGGGILLRSFQGKHGESDTTDVALGLEGGYTFFLSRTVAIEPALYYNISLKDSDWSRFGLKLGFSFYF